MLAYTQLIYSVTGASLLSEKWVTKVYFVMLETQVCVNQRDIGSAPLIQLPVLINTPNGRAPPLVTGTFGSADFLHSLMGEATEYV